MQHIPYNGILHSNLKEQTTNECINMDEPQKIRLSGDTKDYILYSLCNIIHINLIHMKFLLKAKLQRYKIDWWLSEVRDKMEMDGRWAFGLMEMSKVGLW